MLDIKVLFIDLLLLGSDSLNRVEERLGRAVENWHFRTVELYQAVVYSGGVKRGHRMLDGADRKVALSDNGSAVGSYYIFSDSIDWSRALDIRAQEFITVVLGSRAECGVNQSAGMKTFAGERETVLESYLFHDRIGCICVFYEFC